MTDQKRDVPDSDEHMGAVEGDRATDPQGGNPNDTLAIRLMMQNQYTNISGVESLWTAHTVRRANTTGFAAPLGPMMATRLPSGGISVPVTVPSTPGLYRLVATVHQPDGVAYDAATQALVFGDAVEFEEGQVTMSSPIGRPALSTPC